LQCVDENIALDRVTLAVTAWRTERTSSAGSSTDSFSKSGINVSA
jgi:hypothetical protein